MLEAFVLFFILSGDGDRIPVHELVNLGKQFDDRSLCLASAERFKIFLLPHAPEGLQIEAGCRPVAGNSGI